MAILQQSLMPYRTFPSQGQLQLLPKSDTEDRQFPSH